MTSSSASASAPTDPDPASAHLAARVAQALPLPSLVDACTGSTRFYAGLADMVGGGYGDHAWPASVLSSSARELAERVGARLPGIHFVDGPRGVVMSGATTFPISMARGATFDADLERLVGRAVAREACAAGANLFAGVCINLLRHPAWGGAQETYGEDSHHVGEMGAALALGVQDSGECMACVKHFALTSMENARFSVHVVVDERALHEVYLPHFERVVKDARVALQHNLGLGGAVVVAAYRKPEEWKGKAPKRAVSGALGFPGAKL